MKPTPSQRAYDAVVVGSGPNGLSAAVVLAQAGFSVLVLEANATLGGGVRSAELTLPGFVHDTCSAIHPMAIASPFFRSLPLADFGLTWLHPTVPVAHPLPSGEAVLLDRSVDVTAAGLGVDGPAYRRLFSPFVERWQALFADALKPLGLPSSPFLLARFGLKAIRSAQGLTQSWFQTEQARALFAGIAAHAILPLNQALTAAVGLMLGIAGHAVGWPLPKGGSQRLTDALVSYLHSLGGEVLAEYRVESWADLPVAKVYLFDTNPTSLVHIVGDKLSSSYQRALAKYRYGPAACKVDYALAGPIPWQAADCAKAGTVHLGGTFDQIACAESAVCRGELPAEPYVLVAQQSLFDPTRAPPGKQTCWAYCHVPNGCTVDVSARITAQLERYAPGFRDLILAQHVALPADLQQGNANYQGGDLAAGVMDWRQTFFRPMARLSPYTTPAPGVFLCSASTPPGPGVHGMCGYWAAQRALRFLHGK